MGSLPCRSPRIDWRSTFEILARCISSIKKVVAELLCHKCDMSFKS
jgi:hypothetical protein